MDGPNKKPRSADLITPGLLVKRGRFRSVSTASDDSDFTMEGLAKRLDSVNPDVMKENEAVKIELEGIENASETAEEYQSKREELKRQVDRFDVHDKTALDMSSAAVAGAKILLDEKRASRSLTRKILENTGISKNAILYGGLGSSGCESAQVKGIANSRQASVAECLVDYRNQIKFKSNVLSKISQSEKPWRKADEVKRIKVPRDKWKFVTPKKKCNFNPLDCEKIVDKYALEVASDIRSFDSIAEQGRRKIAPIPFSLEESSEDENEEAEAVK